MHLRSQSKSVVIKQLFCCYINLIISIIIGNKNAFIASVFISSILSLSSLSYRRIYMCPRLKFSHTRYNRSITQYIFMLLQSQITCYCQFPIFFAFVFEMIQNVCQYPIQVIYIILYMVYTYKSIYKQAIWLGITIWLTASKYFSSKS